MLRRFFKIGQITYLWQRIWQAITPDYFHQNSVNPTFEFLLASNMA
jgi:hypothetical protein